MSGLAVPTAAEVPAFLQKHHLLSGKVDRARADLAVVHNERHEVAAKGDQAKALLIKLEAWCEEHLTILEGEARSAGCATVANLFAQGNTLKLICHQREFCKRKWEEKLAALEPSLRAGEQDEETRLQDAETGRSFVRRGQAAATVPASGAQQRPALHAPANGAAASTKVGARFAYLRENAELTAHYLSLKQRLKSERAALQAADRETTDVTTVLARLERWLEMHVEYEEDGPPGGMDLERAQEQVTKYRRIRSRLDAEIASLQRKAELFAEALEQSRRPESASQRALADLTNTAPSGGGTAKRGKRPRPKSAPLRRRPAAAAQLPGSSRREYAGRTDQVFAAAAAGRRTHAAPAGGPREMVVPWRALQTPPPPVTAKKKAPPPPPPVAAPVAAPVVVAGPSRASRSSALRRLLSRADLEHRFNFTQPEASSRAAADPRRRHRAPPAANGAAEEALSLEAWQHLRRTSALVDVSPSGWETYRAPESGREFYYRPEGDSFRWRRTRPESAPLAKGPVPAAAAARPNKPRPGSAPIVKSSSCSATADVLAAPTPVPPRSSEDLRQLVGSGAKDEKEAVEKETAKTGKKTKKTKKKKKKTTTTTKKVSLKGKKRKARALTADRAAKDEEARAAADEAAKRATDEAMSQLTSEVDKLRAAMAEQQREHEEALARESARLAREAVALEKERLRLQREADELRSATAEEVAREEAELSREREAAAKLEAAQRELEERQQRDRAMHELDGVVIPDHQWAKYFDARRQRHYYYDHGDGTSTFKRPEGFTSPRAPPSDSGWAKYIDARKRRVYYFHADTARSVFTRPDEYASPSESESSDSDSSRSSHSSRSSRMQGITEEEEPSGPPLNLLAVVAAKSGSGSGSESGPQSAVSPKSAISPAISRKSAAVEVDAETQASVEDEAKEEATVEPEASVKVEAKEEATVEPEASAEVEVEPEAKPEASAEVEPEVKPEASAEVEVEVEPEAKPEKEKDQKQETEEKEEPKEENVEGRPPPLADADDGEPLAALDTTLDSGIFNLSSSTDASADLSLKSVMAAKRLARRRRQRRRNSSHHSRRSSSTGLSGSGRQRRSRSVQPLDVDAAEVIKALYAHKRSLGEDSDGSDSLDEAGVLFSDDDEDSSGDDALLSDWDEEEAEFDDMLDQAAMINKVGMMDLQARSLRTSPTDEFELRDSDDSDDEEAGGGGPSAISPKSGAGAKFEPLGALIEGGAGEGDEDEDEEEDDW